MKIEPTEPTPLPRLLTAAQVGEMLGVRAKRVYELGIPTVQLSERAVRWSLEDVRAFIQSRRGVA